MPNVNCMEWNNKRRLLLCYLSVLNLLIVRYECYLHLSGHRIFRLVHASWDRDIVFLAIVKFAFYSRSACTEYLDHNSL